MIAATRAAIAALEAGETPVCAPFPGPLERAVIWEDLVVEYGVRWLLESWGAA